MDGDKKKNKDIAYFMGTVLGVVLTTCVIVLILAITYKLLCWII